MVFCDVLRDAVLSLPAAPAPACAAADCWHGGIITSDQTGTTGAMCNDAGWLLAAARQEWRPLMSDV
jgi:hypothetical protein